MSLTCYRAVGATTLNRLRRRDSRPPAGVREIEACPPGVYGTRATDKPAHVTELVPVSEPNPHGVLPSHRQSKL